MFESYNFDYVMNKMLAQISDKMDKREGSIIWDALAPAALELAYFYTMLDMVVDEGYADSASYYYLVKRAAEKNLFPKESTKAILKLKVVPATCEVPIGARFNQGQVNYSVISKIEQGFFKAECEKEGIIGNEQLGFILPIEYIEGLQSTELMEVLVPGEEEEDVETFRERYFASFQNHAFGGNITDYKETVNTMNGVGACKVYPVWNGGGTVKVSIISSEFKVPSTTLIESVQEALDPIRSKGEGLGLAPIGHTVTVIGVTQVLININLQLVYQVGYGYSNFETQIKQGIDTYLMGLCKKWSTSETSIVRISQIEALLLEIEGIEDVSRIQINGQQENLMLDSDEIPVRGDILG